jgi:hypothetical protein
MAITFDQFKIVLADSEARAQLGLDLSSDEVQVLQSNEARAISFFETWHQTAGQPITASSSAVYVPVARLVPLSGMAVTGFVFSLVAILAAVSGTGGISAGGFYAAIAGGISLLFAILSRPRIRIGETRGAGLATAAIIIASLAILSGVVSAVQYSIFAAQIG